MAAIDQYSPEDAISRVLASDPEKRNDIYDKWAPKYDQVCTGHMSLWLALIC